MLGIIAAIIDGFKGRTWFAVLSGMSFAFPTAA